MYALTPYAPGPPTLPRGRAANRRLDLAATGKPSANPSKAGAPTVPRDHDRDDEPEREDRERSPCHEDGARMSSETQAALLELMAEPETAAGPEGKRESEKTARPSPVR